MFSLHHAQRKQSVILDRSGGHRFGGKSTFPNGQNGFSLRATRIESLFSDKELTVSFNLPVASVSPELAPPRCAFLRSMQSVVHPTTFGVALSTSRFVLAATGVVTSASSFTPTINSVVPASAGFTPTATGVVPASAVFSPTATRMVPSRYGFPPTAPGVVSSSVLDVQPGVADVIASSDSVIPPVANATHQYTAEV